MKFKFTIESDSEEDGWKRHFKYVHAEELWDILTEVKNIVRKFRKYEDFNETNANAKVFMLLDQLEEAFYSGFEIEE